MSLSIYRLIQDRLVLDTLGPLDADRKCFRMINGVLVERKVKDVKPALQTNSDGLKTVLEELVKQYKKQQDEMDSWKVSQPFSGLSDHDCLLDHHCGRVARLNVTFISQKKNNIQVVQQ